MRSHAACLSVIVFVLLILLPGRSMANMAMPFLNLYNVRQVIAFGLICLYIVIAEGGVIKLLLFGSEGPSFFKAVVISLFLNLLSSGGGAVYKAAFDFYKFEFHINLAVLLAATIIVECPVLIFICGRGYWKKSLLTGIIMNVLSYLVFVLSRFPNGFPLPWEA